MTDGNSAHARTYHDLHQSKPSDWGEQGVTLSQRPHTSMHVPLPKKAVLLLPPLCSALTDASRPLYKVNRGEKRVHQEARRSSL